MNKEKSKFFDILFGILTAIGVYVVGFLLSGRLTISELDNELYPTGYAVLAFPFLFAIICVLIELFSASKNRPIYFKASMITFILPVALLIMFWGFDALRNYLHSSGLLFDDFCGYFQIILLILLTPLSSIFSQIYYVLNEHEMRSVLFMAIPMLAGYIFAIVKYKIDCSRKQNKLTE